MEHSSKELEHFCPPGVSKYMVRGFCETSHLLLERRSSTSYMGGLLFFSFPLKFISLDRKSQTAGVGSRPVNQKRKIK